MRFCEIPNCERPVFRTDKNTRTGYCTIHWKQHSTDINKDSILVTAIKKRQRQNAVTKTQSKLRSLSHVSPDIREGEGVDKVHQAEMDLFWKTAAKELDEKPYCMECGKFIPAKYYRAATAHCLPKRKEYGFPSVASNLNNRLFLGAGCGCHARYDRSWEDAAQMKVWPLAVEKFKILYPLIATSERKNIPEVLRQEILLTP